MRKFLLILLLLWIPVAQSVELKDFQGQDQDLSTFIGQDYWSVVMIWAHDCPICNEEVQAYDLFHLEHEDGDVRVLGISIDGGAEDQAMAFIQRHEPSFTNWIGRGADVARMVMELSGRPSSMVASSGPMPRCDTATPLGTPVDPEVNTT